MIASFHMDSPDVALCLLALRQRFEQGGLRTYAQRKHALEQLQRFLKTHEQNLMNALHADMGKPPLEAYISEVAFLHEELTYTLKHLKKWMAPRRVPTPLFLWPGSSRLYPHPLGVCLIISPWNYPLQLALAPLAGCLAAGNTAVVLLSDQAPNTARFILEHLPSYLPQDVVWPITGEGGRLFDVLTQSTRFDHIFFTGSTTIGKVVARRAAESLTPVTLELGGKSPCIVLPDADSTVAARRIVWGKSFNAGQTCVSPDYVLVHHSLKEHLVQAMKEALAQMYPQSSRSVPSESYARMVHHRRWRTVVAYLDSVEILHGGASDESTLWIEPTIVAPASWEAPVMQEEIFGPVLPVFTYQTDDELHALLDRHPNPLALYVFGNQGSKELLHLRSFGGGIRNHILMHLANPNLPFGGVGMSGMGRYHGVYSFQCFSHFKSVMEYPTWLDLPLMYPPYKGKLKWLKKLIG